MPPTTAEQHKKTQAEVKALREEAGKAVHEMRRIRDKVLTEKRALTPEEQTAFDNATQHYNDLKTVLDLAAKVAEMDLPADPAADPSADPNAPVDPNAPPSQQASARAAQEEFLRGHPANERQQRLDQVRATAIRSWFKAQVDKELSDEEVKACRAVGLRPGSKELCLRLFDTPRLAALQRVARNSHHTARQQRMQEQRTLSANVVGTGGALVAPESMVTALEVNMLAYGPMNVTSEIIRTSSGEPLRWPTANDTTNKGRQIGESVAVTATDPSFGGVTWGAYKLSSDEILVPYELLEDAVIDLPTVLGDMLGERLGRIQNEKYTTGSGAATAKGIVTAATLGATTAGATAILTNELYTLIHSVDPAYRQGAGFMMNDAILLQIRLLKDLNGAYMWQPNVQLGLPDTLAGYPVAINQDMDASLTALYKTVLFGQLNKYKIRKVNEIRIYRLQERYRENDQDAFLAFTREDGNLLTAGTAPVKYLQQHS